MNLYSIAWSWASVVKMVLLGSHLRWKPENSIVPLYSWNYSSIVHPWIFFFWKRKWRVTGHNISFIIFTNSFQMYYLADAQSSALNCPFVKRTPIKISFPENWRDKQSTFDFFWYYNSEGLTIQIDPYKAIENNA